MEAFVELFGLVHEGGYLAAAAVIFSIWWAYRALREDIKKDISESFDSLNNEMIARFDVINDKFDSLEKRLHKIDRTLETIQQNHLDHLSIHHVNHVRVEPVMQNQENPS